MNHLKNLKKKLRNKIQKLWSIKKENLVQVKFNKVKLKLKIIIL